MVFQTAIVTEISSYPAIVHCSSVIYIQGEGICVWYEGPYETSEKTVLRISRKPAGASTWTQPSTLFDFHGLALGNPVLWRLSDTELFLTFPVLLAESWTESYFFIRSVENRGTSWQPPSLFFPQERVLCLKTRPPYSDNGSHPVSLVSMKESFVPM